MPGPILEPRYFFMLTMLEDMDPGMREAYISWYRSGVLKPNIQRVFYDSATLFPVITKEYLEGGDMSYEMCETPIVVIRDGSGEGPSISKYYYDSNYVLPVIRYELQCFALIRHDFITYDKIIKEVICEEPLYFTQYD